MPFDSLTQQLGRIVAVSGGLIIASVGILLAAIFRARQRRLAAPRHEPPTLPADQPPPVNLQLILPNQHGIPLNHFPLSIGRSAENDIVLDSSTVSAVHARLYRDPATGKVYIEDNHSRNGILLNGYPTQKNILSDCDIITLGNVSLTYRVSHERVSSPDNHRQS